MQTLLVAGAVTSGCVRASVVDAMQYGFRPLVVSDCVGDRAIGPHEANLFDMRQKYATVLTRDEACGRRGPSRFAVKRLRREAQPLAGAGRA